MTTHVVFEATDGDLYTVDLPIRRGDRQDVTVYQAYDKLMDALDAAGWTEPEPLTVVYMSGIWFKGIYRAPGIMPELLIFDHDANRPGSRAIESLRRH